MTGLPSRSARRVPTWVRYAVSLVVLGLVVMFGVVPQLSGARSAVDLLSTVSPGLLVLGLILELASLVGYSMLTRTLMPVASRPTMWTTFRIDVSALGLSHVVPGGGATSTALRYRLFTRAGVNGADVLGGTTIEAAGTAVVLALVFGIGLLLAFPVAMGDPSLFAVAAGAAVLVTAAAVSVVALLHRREQSVRAVRWLARWVPRASQDAAERLVRNIVAQLDGLAADRRLLVRTLMLSSANWLFDAASLWVFLRAFGESVGVGGLLVGYGLASLLALLPVSPGGLGIVEASLVAVLVVFGLQHGHAIVGVVTWRVAEFWLPIPLAAAAYASLRISGSKLVSTSRAGR